MQLEGATLARLAGNLFTIVGLALLAGLLAAVLGLIHRWYARSTIPGGLAVLTGLTGVVLVLNVDTALGTLIATPGGDAGQPGTVLTGASVAVNTVTIAAGGVAAAAGGRLGDQVGESILTLTGSGTVDIDVSGLVEAVDRVITVDLPDEVADMDGYDPVPPTVKTSLSGATLVFPRRLTIDELHDRLVERLRDDYGVGHVDVIVAADGTVEYLAVGSRESGLGPTLPPETCAVAVRADPALATSAGDLVQVFRDGANGPERVAAGELRATVGDVVTLAVDAADADAFDPETRYRLVTLPVEPRSDREFASLLRAADETMGVLTVATESPLVGSPIGAIDAAIVAVRDAEGLVPLPSRDRVVAPGDTLYVIATPSRLRRLDAGIGRADSD
ncbi:TrkA C-terminal domain-containing protein [Halosegnis sp.]|uniref:TrkA C-terminal domain-containing protein n=1 Tax=Halosegnis sp. TaxID=2864959 RepID=UPI0035D4290B